VIDDEPLLLRGLAKSLRSLGLKVTTANSGREGLSLYQRDDFALVLCDLMMPNFTGQDFYRELEKMGSGHAEKVVVVTGGAFTKDTMRFLDRPDVYSLTKPFTLDELKQIVRKHMPGKLKQH
jgi:CheY-like chemotaxis protein